MRIHEEGQIQLMHRRHTRAKNNSPERDQSGPEIDNAQTKKTSVGKFLLLQLLQSRKAMTAHKVKLVVGLSFLCFISSIGGSELMQSIESCLLFNSSQRSLRFHRYSYPVEIVFPTSFDLTTSLDMRSLKPIERAKHSKRREHDRLDFKPVSNFEQGRQIRYKDGDNFYNRVPRDYMPEKDDSIIKHMKGHLGAIMLRPDDLPDRECQQPEWTWTQYPVCNFLHEVCLADSLLGYGLEDIQYLDHGYFRDSWLIKPGIGFNDYPYVMKILRQKHRFDIQSLRKIQIEALAMERTSASDRKITSYGYCGATVLVEEAREFYKEIVPSYSSDPDEVDHLLKNGVYPLNNLTLDEKLDMAITMAEGLAELHAMEGGVLTNNDVHPEQWLRSVRDGKLKLNDFNNGVFMEWSRSKEQYCPYYSCFGGEYHAPEEYRCTSITEKADVFSFGHIMYAIMTGLWIFYDKSDTSEKQEIIVDGGRPYIDPRWRNHTYVDRQFVKIIRETWKDDVSKRASIFRVLQVLRETRNDFVKLKRKV